MAARARRPFGGYDCEFVTSPSEAIQTECPVCLQIPREPCLISCPCGKEFCRECIERIKDDNKPCPLCNLSDFTFLRHHGSERYLKAQEVWCSHNKDGCEWRGKLGEYEQHLNEDPSQENQLSGCQFVEVGCVHGCGERFQRRHIASHQKDVCPKRAYSCEYCREYDSTFEEVTKNHCPQCVKYPVPCPNKCQEAPFERQKVDNHVKDECPLTEIHCPLHYAGCGVRLPRKDMPQHMSDTFTHLTLLATVTQTLLKENHELRQITEDLKKENTELRRDIEENQEQQNEKEGMLNVTEKIFETANVIMTNAMRLNYPIIFPVNYAIRTIQHSPSFSTHSHGYNMCLQVHTNGFLCGKGTHVSIYTRLLQGRYDDHLKWPFRGEITVQILNQAGDHSHVEDTITYNDQVSENMDGRVVDNYRLNVWGYHEFLPLTDLHYNAAKKTQYLKDDIIIFRVISVKITQ